MRRFKVQSAQFNIDVLVDDNKTDAVVASDMQAKLGLLCDAEMDAEWNTMWYAASKALEELTKQLAIQGVNVGNKLFANALEATVAVLHTQLDPVESEPTKELYANAG